MAPKYPSIPEPTLDPQSLRDAVLTLKQAFEVLTGQRGNQDYRAVLLPELVASDNADDAAIAANAAAIVALGARLTAIEANAVRVDTAQAFTNAQIERGLLNIRQGKATQLAVGTNLNTIQSPGLYDGTTLVNAPDAISWFYIEVRQHSNYTPTNTWVTQRAWCLTDPAALNYMRIGQASGASTAWGAWHRFTVP